MPEGPEKDALAGFGAIRDAWAKHLERIDTVMRDYADGKINDVVVWDALKPYRMALNEATKVANYMMIRIKAERAKREGAKA